MLDFIYFDIQSWRISHSRWEYQIAVGLFANNGNLKTKKKTTESQPYETVTENYYNLAWAVIK